MAPAQNEEEEVKEPEDGGGGDESGDGENKKGKIKVVHKLYENEDKDFVVYGLCCNIL